MSSVLFWLLLASEDDDGSNVDKGSHGQRQQQDACVVDKDNNSCRGACIVEDKRRGGTANPSIGGKGVRPVIMATARRHHPPPHCSPLIGVILVVGNVSAFVGMAAPHSCPAVSLLCS